MSADPAATIRQFARQASKHAPPRWLPADPSAAFICCIGAGPWKYTRRRAVQAAGLRRLAGRDLGQVIESIDWFPLAWQNQFTQSLCRHLAGSMTDFCTTIQRSGDVTGLYRACGTGYAKTLSLFARDYLDVPAFPIDRHCRRGLIAAGLPVNEQALLKLCTESGVDASSVARYIVSGLIDGSNPDWSQYPAVSAATMKGTVNAEEQTVEPS